MLLVDPPPSPYDLHFRAFGIPVRVNPWFWVIALLFGVSGSQRADPFKTILWVVVLFVSILVHELGHAFLQRFYGGRPRITLYGMGGLAACDDCDRSPLPQILISLAGPVAGFLLAGVVVAILAATGHFEGFQLDFMPVKWIPFDMNHILERQEYSPRDAVIADLLWINIFWGLVNLLPIYPLDGGRVAREVLTLRKPRQGIVNSLWLSTITSGGVAALGIMVFGSFFMAFFFGYLAYSSYQTLQAYERY
jgi:stage IV sporulation protein FB